MTKPKKVGNPFVFHTLAFDKSTGNDDGRTGNNRDRSEGDKGFGDLGGEEEFLMDEEEEFLMYYSAGSTHLADSNIDEPLYLGLGQSTPAKIHDINDIKHNRTSKVPES